MQNRTVSPEPTPTQRRDKNEPVRAGSRILVVDDHAPSAEMLAEILMLEGHEVRMAHTAVDAVTVARSFAPRIAVLDIGLPDQDGFELARHIKCDPQLRDIRLIGVSGYGQSHYPKRAKQAGFEHYLVKPVDLDELLMLVRKLV
jgi:two-component system, chemotaxis family, CheB/CheR fusion protein